MRRIWALAVLLPVVAYPLSAVAQHAALFDELVVLYPDSDVGSGTQEFASDTPRGVPLTMFLAVRHPSPPLLGQLRVCLSHGGRGKSHLDFLQSHHDT